MPPVRPISERQLRTRISSKDTFAAAAIAVISSRAEGICSLIVGIKFLAISHALVHSRAGVSFANRYR
jgi:hypothetical protein